VTGFDRLPGAVAEFFGDQATAEAAYGLLTVDVPALAWITALTTARDSLGCTYFDWLSAVDEPGTGFHVCAHVVALGDGRVRRLLVRTTVPHEAPALPTATEVYAGAAWHERETHEMFGIGFTGHPHLEPLLLPEGFEGHPLRKDFVLAARVAKAWPGAKEPGEPEHGGPKRRQVLPPGVPDPNEWGPLKGQLPPAPARPARAAGDRPPRRTRSVAQGSSSQQTQPAAAASAAAGAADAPAPAPAGSPARRSRTADAPWEKPHGSEPSPAAQHAGTATTGAEGPLGGAAGSSPAPATREAPRDAQPSPAPEAPQASGNPEGTSKAAPEETTEATSEEIPEAAPEETAEAAPEAEGGDIR
jgi:NADH:ubiquinone oxidoreductase subunit C